MEFNHIKDCWKYFENVVSSVEKTEDFDDYADKVLEQLEEAFGEIPNKFGSFEITNKDTIEEDWYIDICNSFWNADYIDYDFLYHTIYLD